MLTPGIEWRDRLPDSVTGLVIANEWLDNVPLDVVELTGDGPRLVVVDPRTGAELPGPTPAPEDTDWIDRWWPLRPFSMGEDKVAAVTFERRVGGRVYETWQDGTEREWGVVLDWAPPERFVMTWNASGTPTEVELRFTTEGAERTRVDLEHRGWEKLSEEQLRADCALPGGYLGGSFSRGWDVILQRLLDAAEHDGKSAAGRLADRGADILNGQEAP